MMTLKPIVVFVALASLKTVLLKPLTPTISLMQPKGIRFVIPGKV